MADTCTNCATIVGNFYSGDPAVGLYSIREDGFGPGYSSFQMDVYSNILKHRSVYTLDTLDTLVDDHVGGGTRAVVMDFFTTAFNDVPECWRKDGQPISNPTADLSVPDLEVGDLTVAVNWSIFSSNQVFFTEMETGTEYPGRYRMDFNVRNPVCDDHIFRFFLKGKGGDLIITLENDVVGARVWKVVTSELGGLKFGEADLSGQGGRRKETLEYGTYRLPHEMTLTEE